VVDHIYKTIEGWFGPTEEVLYQEVVDRVSESAHFVEVGCFKGKSSAMMAVMIANSGKDIKFDCVDTFEGSPEHQKGASFEDGDVVKGTLFDTFTKNVEPVKYYINPIVGKSVEVAESYEDESIDFLFLDADHVEESVYADLCAWWPKIKPNGVFAGHDYDITDKSTGVHRAVVRFFEDKMDQISPRGGSLDVPYCGCFFLVKVK
jgi:predicted O-methyltransferase YrrM